MQTRIDSFHARAYPGSPREDGSQGGKKKGLQFGQGAALLCAKEKGWEHLARDMDDDGLLQHVGEGKEKSWVQAYRALGAACGRACVLIFSRGNCIGHN